jgi:putative transcriptional regulator
MKKKHSKTGLELIAAMTEVRGHVQGKVTLKTLSDRIRSPKPISKKEIKLLRERSFHASQGAFARVMNVKKVTVEKWERGENKPSGATLKLLSIAKKHPEILLEEED